MKGNNYLTVSIGDLPMVREMGGRVRSPQDVADRLGDLAGLAQEAFVVITLSAKSHFVGRHLVTLGLANASLAHPREVFRAAIADGAIAVVLAHNHPSGDPAPSPEDIRLTRQLVETGKVIDIPVLDHVIIGRNGDRVVHLSLRESGNVVF